MATCVRKEPYRDHRQTSILRKWAALYDSIRRPFPWKTAQSLQPPPCLRNKLHIRFLIGAQRFRFTHSVDHIPAAGNDGNALNLLSLFPSKSTQGMAKIDVKRSIKHGVSVSFTRQIMPTCPFPSRQKGCIAWASNASMIAPPVLMGRLVSMGK